jgi:SSS family solute:Na+ symporter
MIITFGLNIVFFALVVWTLQRAYVVDQSFTDYAVGGRSFGGFFQAMSFLNTWYPGVIFVAFVGLAAGSGVLGFYPLSYSALTVVLMYIIARPVWVWGKHFDLKTQPDLFALRYGSRHIRTITALIGIISGFPWLVLGMQALGTLFRAMSLGTITFGTAVLIGVGVMVIRQVWTIRMGMRGVIISDMVQGVVAYVVGTGVIIALIVWLLIVRDVKFSSVMPELFEIPGIGSKQGPLYLFALIFTGTLGGWCWPSIFVRLYTADGVKSLKKSAAICIPLGSLFYGSLVIMAILASTLPEIAKNPDQVWFILSRQAGGPFLLGIAGVIVLAASMGNIDGAIQATGAQIANDLVGNYRKLPHGQLVWIAKGAMVLITLFAAWLSCLELPKLFTLAVLAYQGIIQLSVPQFLGIVWKRGNKAGAIGGMVGGFITAVSLEVYSPGPLPWAFGLTSGVIGLAVNLLIYVVAAYAIPRSAAETHRLASIFALVEGTDGRVSQIADHPAVFLA